MITLGIETSCDDTSLCIIDYKNRNVKKKLQELEVGEIVITRDGLTSWRPAMVVEKGEGQVILHLFGTYSKIETPGFSRTWKPAWVDTKDGKEVYAERGLRSYEPLQEVHTSLKNLLCFSPILKGTDKKQGGKLSKKDKDFILNWIEKNQFVGRARRDRDLSSRVAYNCNIEEYDL